MMNLLLNFKLNLLLSLMLNLTLSLTLNLTTTTTSTTTISPIHLLFLQRSLPDYLDHGMDIVFIGINPGLIAAYKQHYYAGPGNHFWKCLFLSGEFQSLCLYICLSICIQAALSCQSRKSSLEIHLSIR